MINLHFARCGMVILLSALLAGFLVFGSCSFGGSGFEEETEIENYEKDDTAANNDSPVTNKDPPDPVPPDEEEEPDDEEDPDDLPDPVLPDDDEDPDDLPDPVLPDEEEEPDDLPDPVLPDDDEDPDDLPDPVLPDDEEEPNDPTDPTTPDDKEEPDDLPDPTIPDDEEKDIPSSRVPQLLINELRTEYQRSPPRAEFIEFKMLSAGNLGGIRVFIVTNTRNPFVYEFQPVEVKKGEYVVLHLRTLEDSCRDEYGDDLNESGGSGASPTARDLWVPGNTKLLNKTGAVYVMDQDDRILDAVMLAEDTIPARSIANFFEAAEFLYSKGVWKSADGTKPGHEDAVKTSRIGSALTRSVSRDETAPNTNTAADWYITADGGVTPGGENSPNRL